MIAHFAMQRASFLRCALIEATKWCPPPEWLVEGNRADQFWLQVFSGPSACVTAANVREFFIVYRLARQGQWNHQAVAERIMASRGPDGSDIREVIRALAGFLRNAVARGGERNRQQTSAGSKIGFFLRPLDSVHIWEKFAILSTRFRDWRRAGGRGRPARFDQIFRSASGDHDYALFWDSCAKALAEERTCPNFVAAVEEFRSFLRQAGGPMADQAIIASSFIERRLLDKLMWCEGRWVQDWRNNRGQEPS
jgi:hypothetical protein